MDILDQIQSQFRILCHHRQRPDMLQIEADADRVAGLLSWLRKSTSYRQLTHMSAVDWPEDDDMQVTYMVTDPAAFHMLMISARIDREEARAESISHLWPEAVTYEQELHEMYGIDFPGSPRQGEDFMLEGWDGPPPMLRDFDPLEFAEERYGFRPGRDHTDVKAVRAEFMAKEKARKAAEKAAREKEAAAKEEDGA